MNFTKLKAYHEVTTPYTLKYNEVVERRNKMILNIARSMLTMKSKPNNFWG